MLGDYTPLGALTARGTIRNTVEEPSGKPLPHQVDERSRQNQRWLSYKHVWRQIPTGGGGLAK